MRVFVAGASGAVGRRLVPQLVDRGHDVVATARTPEKLEALRALGAERGRDGRPRRRLGRRGRCARPSPRRSSTR